MHAVFRASPGWEGCVWLGSAGAHAQCAAGGGVRGSGLIMQASMGRFFFVEGSTDEDGHLHDISVDDLKATDSFDTVEQFWHYYDHIVRANELPPNIDCCLFVDGIKPDIDHEANRGGGKWCGCVATFSRVCPC